MNFARTGLTVLFLATVCALAGCRGGPDESSGPTQQGRVNDFAGVLSDSTVAALSRTLQDYEEETCHQVVVAVFPSLKGELISDLSSRIMDSWEVGHPHLENGLLVTVALQEGGARIDAGSGLEVVVADQRGESILRHDMFPSFKENRIDEGIRQGLESIMEEGRKIVIPPDLRPPVCRTVPPPSRE
jgi:uncharacterized protein